MTLMQRRRILVGGPVCAGLATFAFTKSTRAATMPHRAALSLDAPEPMARLHVNDQGTLLGVSVSGNLWRRARTQWLRLGAGLDPAAPLASGYGRVVGRSREGGLWVLEAGRSVTSRNPELAAHAGMLVLALGVIAIARGADGPHQAVRLEPGGSGRWAETARSGATVLPDARPVRFDPEGTMSDENGHVVVLGGPDATRYRHGVLGDNIEATTLLHIERHSLQRLGQLDLPAPFVFEDIAPRPIIWRGRRALVTVRSGPKGAQMAVVAAGQRDAAQLTLAALGEPIGAIHRWLSPITDGTRMLAVHTPHLVGVLHRYSVEGDRLIGVALTDGVTNHVIGQRDLDMSAWVGRLLVVPTQDRRGLRILDPDAHPSTVLRGEVDLGAPVVSVHHWARDGKTGSAALLQGGEVAWAAVTP